MKVLLILATFLGACLVAGCGPNGGAPLTPMQAAQESAMPQAYAKGGCDPRFQICEGREAANQIHQEISQSL